MTEPSMLDAALDALEHGFAVVPPAEDGTKRPLGEWKKYQQQLPTEDDVRAWYAGGRTGLGVVTGAVSGNLEMLEFEGRAMRENITEVFADLAAAAGLTELVNRINAGYCETTPTGGLHLLYRVTDAPVAGNTKLARRPATPDELAEKPDDPIRVLIETRGEGGYVVVAPSHGAVHPNGSPWVLLNGGFDTVATITGEERDELHRIARAIDTLPTAAPASRPAGPAPTFDVGGDDRPGDAYNQDPAAPARTLQVLEHAGWVEVFRRPHDGHDDIHLRRPGKNIGTSAVLHMDAGTFVNFSTSVAGFDQEQGYTPFAVLAQLQHAGDYQAAARHLRPEGQRRDDFRDFVLSKPAAAPPIEEGDTTTETTERLAWQLPSPSIDEFLDEPEPEYDWLIPGLVERGDRIIVTAGEGMGKSTLIRQIATQAAAGIHPFTLEEIPPIRVVVLDLENSRRHVRRQMRPLRDVAGDQLTSSNLVVSVVPEGIDLMHREGLDALDDLLGRVTPDLVAVGPLYKLASGDPKDEEQAQAVRKALDHYRAIYDCALLIEAHQPYATGGSTKRPLRPYGASLWSRWPEFGIAIVGEIGAPTAQLLHWRGARDERQWPAALNRGEDWPWETASDRDITFALILEIGREHAAKEGALPSVRAIEKSLVERGSTVGKSTVARAIKANQKTWEAITEGDPR